MRVRTGVLPAMWALVLRRLFQAGGGVLNDGRVSEVVRPGIDIGPDGEEHPSPMRRGDACHPDPDSSGMRTYEEQRAFQREEGEDIVTGAWVLGAGVFGPGGPSVRRRSQKARARRPYEVRARGP